MSAEMWRDRQGKALRELIETREDLIAIKAEVDELLTIAEESGIEKAKTHRITQQDRSIRRLKARLREAETCIADLQPEGDS